MGCSSLEPHSAWPLASASCSLSTRELKNRQRRWRSPASPQGTVNETDGCGTSVPVRSQPEEICGDEAARPGIALAPGGPEPLARTVRPDGLPSSSRTDPRRGGAAESMAGPLPYDVLV